MSSLSHDEINKLLKEQAAEQPAKQRKTRQRKDPTEPRTADTWFKLPHRMLGADNEPLGCKNPDCSDPRPTNDKGRNVVAEVKGTFMCRYCYISGWLSDSKD